MFTNYISLSTKKGYNNSLQHFRVVTEVITLLEEGSNLASVINDLETDGFVNKDQILPILNSVLVEKLGYSYKSFSLKRSVSDLTPITKELSKWNKFDVVICYHHPQIGVCLINILDQTHWERIGDLSSEELIVIYTVQKGERSTERETVFIGHVEKILQEGTSDSHSEYYSDAYVLKNPELEEIEEVKIHQPKSAPVEIKKELKNVKMTPKYRCQVTNELFHNGNVEAWKNIIESYSLRYPELDVFIFHDGKRVNNINSLFKWGKVKNGDVILFSVAGDNFKGIAKLQRYLFEGAGNRYEQFLKKDINQPLRLF